MPLLAPIMSTTSTYVQVDEFQKTPTTFHNEVFSGSLSDYSNESRPQSEPASPRSEESTQRVLLLKGAREQYALVNDHAIPSVLHEGEILVKISRAFNFGIPSLPWINGRDLAGLVLQVPQGSSRLRVGDVVLVPSTDYRDIRKAAFQEYAIATDFNAARIPSSASIHASASVGVAFVAAALALGVSFGLDFSLIAQSPGPDLPSIVSTLDKNDIPSDIRDECFASLLDSQKPQPGEWVAIWGASTTTGLIALQLAKLAGLRVICVADAARHGAKLIQSGADLLVDRQDPDRAVEVIRGVTEGKLRYAIDIVGRETATLLERTLNPDGHAHLLGLSGLPKEQIPGIQYHTVPIKLFHTAPAVGEAMVCWLEELLQSTTLTLPEIVHAEGGLEGINAALETLRSGSVSGKRIVVDLGSL
ncbi:unnamed protein product [Penicillium olsonii]|uniref:Alcohol dehydrogenase-like C-terminal domain-containing protein n=1 Tax=Penicillium olsonii TaxID=99116 RepID=A0A9W4HLS9_PENOL|nr:unnamed protein product [Penicillium olsonii]CAG8081323.1 unnamed protein product [Penicillium olsonii]